MTPTIAFECLHFQALSLQQLYSILALRQEVFVVEQNCPYQDADGKDLHCWHLLGCLPDGQLAAYARLLPLGLAYDDYPAIGRIITAQSVRGTGAGRILVAEAIRHCQILWGNTPLKIGAQAHLERFYQAFGFVSTGELYLEDGIPHVRMIRPAYI